MFSVRLAFPHNFLNLVTLLSCYGCATSDAQMAHNELRTILGCLGAIQVPKHPSRSPHGPLRGAH